jgi:hypothetical protein
MVLVGDVRGRTAIIVDDMADTCGTLVKAADVVVQHGAKDAIAIVTHGILSANAIDQINGSQLKKIVVTNTVPHEEKKERCDRIETIDISPTVSSAPSHHRNLLILDIACRSVQAYTQRRECILPLQACACGLRANLDFNSVVGITAQTNGRGVFAFGRICYHKEYYHSDIRHTSAFHLSFDELGHLRWYISHCIVTACSSKFYSTSWGFAR